MKQPFWGVQVRINGVWKWLVDLNGDFMASKRKGSADQDAFDARPRVRRTQGNAPLRVRKCYIVLEVDDE